jgi:hypothetical protein
MTYWEARQDFDPTADYGWVEVICPEDTICVQCGFALAELDPALMVSVWFPMDPAFYTQADWEDSLIYAHTPDTCETVGTQVTIRTKE